VSAHREFEDAIERAMLASGWMPGQASNYRREFGLDTADWISMLRVVARTERVAPVEMS
jgi:hypothetical protein